MRAIVIGAGLGGLSSAIRLANLGIQVDVYEQSNHPGGKAGVWEKGGYRFDTGPSLITMIDVLQEPFIESGEDPDKYLKFTELKHLCNYFYPDWTRLSAVSDIDSFGKQVEELMDDSSEDLKNYLLHCKTIYDLTAKLFLYHSVTEPKDLINLDTLGRLLNLKKADINRTMDQANEAFFKDPKMVQLFNRYATFNGSDPYQCPATMNLIQHVEYGMGAYTCEGGIFAIPRELEALAKRKGVRFHYNTKVQKILHSGKHVQGVQLDGYSRLAELVISDCDVKTTYQDLMDDTTSKPSKRYMDLEPSSSALVFYWGIKHSFDELTVHNIFFSDNYQFEFQQIFKDGVCPDDPTIYVNITSKTEPDAPDGCENWFVMVNAPYDRGQDWEAAVEKMRRTIVRRLSKELRVDIEPLIQVEDVLTPPLIDKRTSSFKGSLYGISSNSKLAAFLRQPNRSRTYKGLYFCGGSAHPGGGMPLAILSGRIVGELVQRHERG